MMPGSSTLQILTSFLTACLVRRCVCVLWSQQRCVVREVGRGGGARTCGCVSLCVHIHQNKEFDDFSLPNCTIIGYIRPSSLRAITDSEKPHVEEQDRSIISAIRGICVLLQYPSDYVSFIANICETRTLNFLVKTDNVLYK